jgi:ankyrin repeat protein
MWACDGGHAESVGILLEAGAKVGARDAEGRTALMWVAHGRTALTGTGHPDVVQKLLAAGADVNAKDKAGRSALTWARWNRNDAIVAALRQAGARD